MSRCLRPDGQVPVWEAEHKGLGTILLHSGRVVGLLLPPGRRQACPPGLEPRCLREHLGETAHPHAAGPVMSIISAPSGKGEADLTSFEG